MSRVRAGVVTRRRHKKVLKELKDTMVEERTPSR